MNFFSPYNLKNCKINPLYKTNTFILPKPTFLIQKYSYLLSQKGGLDSQTNDQVVIDIIKETLPQYITEKKIDLNLMCFAQRKFCMDLCKKFYPDYLKINNILE